MYPHNTSRLKQLHVFKKALWSMLPLQTWDELRFELHAFKIRCGQLFRINRYRKHQEFYLNIGCGGNGVSGWLNLDLFPAPGVNCLWDARRSLPFRSRSCEGIFCEHFLEHLEYTLEVPTFLRECKRVLKAGGVIRILVPDGEAYLHAYCHGGWDGLRKLRQLDSNKRDPWFGHQYESRMELINMVFRQGVEHAFAYDFETLNHVLTQVGFTNVRKCSPRDSFNSKMNLDYPKRFSESLIVEAQA